jgi:hypothetical protein
MCCVRSLRRVAAVLFAGACAVSRAGAQPAPPVPPDLQVLASTLSGWTVQTTAGGGRELRLPVHFANAGQNPLYVFGGTTYDDGTQDVMERLFDQFGGSEDRVAGRTTHQPGGLRVDGWAQYRLRVRPANQSVGPVVAQSEYQSACLGDTLHTNPSLQGSPPAQVFATCGTTQGISIGWSTVLGVASAGQAIDVTCIPNGDYWLEAEVDPHHWFTESDETNNTGRLAITLTGQPAGGFFFAADPASISVNAGSPVSMAATLTGTPTSMRWQRNGMDVINGGAISGATTPTLTIASASAANAGVYTLVATGPCGSRTSAAAVLTVVSLCPADFNQSGATTVQDIFDFLAAWFGGVPAADFNHAGGLSVQDIFDFLAAWFAGC